MAIRSVLQNPKTHKWAYIEYNHSMTRESILGGKEFDTKDEAIEWSKGFDPFSYKWQDPVEMKKENLLEEKKRLESSLQKVNESLNNL